jgi:threonine/homoserine/homoserine lactone efflux protein
MLSAHALFAVAALWLFAVITPGPAFLITARYAVTRSRQQALLALTGLLIGTSCWAVASFLGVTVLFAAAPWLFRTLKIVGGGYLIYLGIRMLLTRPQPADSAPQPDVPAAAVRMGLITNLTNPKSPMFLTSVFATALPQHFSIAMGAEALALMLLISACWYGLVALLFGSVPVAAAYRRSRVWIDRIAGSVFVLIGARLATI